MEPSKRLILPNGRIAYISQDNNISIYGQDDTTFICSMSADDVKFLYMFLLLTEENATDSSSEQKRMD